MAGDDEVLACPDIRKQLQDVSDLLNTRYGKNSSIAEIAVKTLVSATLLEHELLIQENETVDEPMSDSLNSTVAH